MTPEKTPEKLIEQMKLQPWRFVKEPPTQPDYHTMALLAAQTIPNQTVGELFASADKIEAWLRKPEIDGRKRSEEFRKRLFGDYPKEVHKKSPDNNVKASEDNDVFP